MEWNYDRLVALVESRRMSVATLAKKCDVSKQCVYGWLSGASRPGLDHILIMCQIFKVQIGYFFPSQKPKPALV